MSIFQYVNVFQHKKFLKIFLIEIYQIFMKFIVIHHRYIGIF